jgi:hypothetical protein
LSTINQSLKLKATSQNKTKQKKLATKLTKPAISNLTSSSKTTTKKKKKKQTNKQTKEQKRKRKKHARARAHTHANQNNGAKQANKTNSSSDAQKLINQAPDATTNRQVPKTKDNVSAIAIGLMSF